MRHIKNAIAGYFLGKYRGGDYVIEQKATVLFIVTSAVLVLVLPVYAIFFSSVKDDMQLGIIILLVIALSIVVLVILKSGHYFLAAHSLMILVFAAIWTTILTDIGGDIIQNRMDTIALVLGLLVFTPLVTYRRTHVIVFYFAANILAFIAFVFLLLSEPSLHRSTVFSYILDTGIAMLMIGVISYQVFRINTAALDRSVEAVEMINRGAELFRGVVEGSPQEIIIVNADGTLEFVSEFRASAFGYTLEEIPRIDRWWELAFPDENYRMMIIKEWGRMKRDTLASGCARPIEARILSREGSIHDIMIRYVSLDGGRGLMLLDDVTNRKIVERSLLASERRYRALYDSMLDGFVSLDMEGNILEFNSAYRQMTGYSSAELRRMSVWDLTPGRWHDMQKTIMGRDVLARGHSDIFEKEYRRRDGTLIPVELRIQLIRDEEGNNKGTWSIVHDITERKKSEEELLKTCKIESLGVFAGGIAHDFNNLLTAILGNISIAKMEADPENPNYRSLVEATHAAERARDLTMQLLTFSRGGAPIKKLSSIRDLLVDTSEFVLSGSGIRSEFSISDDLWGAEIDEGQISQVIHNLVLNAREAMPEGGVVAINACNRTVKSGEIPHIDGGNYIQLRISDTGCGIPKRDLHKIFDPFYTTKEKGNGLGLSVTYSIIKRHNGCITTDSSLRKGTVFTVLLPAAKESPPRSERTIAFPILKSGRILVMDDEEMVLHVASRIIDRLGFSVTTARDGNEAIELYTKGMAEGTPFDLVIMDLTVPGGMGGRDAIKLLRQIDPSVRAIVSSGYSNDPVMASFRDYGFLSVVAKPYSIEDLSDAIRRACG